MPSERLLTGRDWLGAILFAGAILGTVWALIWWLLP